MSSPSPGTERALTFRCAGHTLMGILHAPPVAGQRGVLLLVGGPQYRVGSHRQFVQLARALAAEGYPVLRFDCRGMGDSEGEFPGFEHLSPDIQAGLAALRGACPGVEEIVLWGLCDGATAGIFYAAAAPHSVAGLVAVNPWVRTAQGQAQAYVRHYYARRWLQGSFWRKLGRGEIALGPTFRSFLTDLRRAWPGPAGAGSGVAEPAALPVRVRQALAAFSGPRLVILSGQDLTAGEFGAWAKRADWQGLFAGPGRQWLDLPEADHTFSKRPAQAALSQACALWLRSW